MTTAVVFPGQGSQQPGMAKAWLDHPAAARWEEASDLLARDVRRLAVDADADELREPANCQVALFVHHVVLLEAYTDAGGAEAAVLAGHSLGEYDALYAAQVLGFADALRLVDVRARSTQDAADAHPGTLVACLGFDVETVRAACGETATHVANDNAPGQVVVAGTDSGLADLRERLEASGERGKVMPLDVGAAYHSPHMAPALEVFGAALDAAAFQDAQLPVVANVDAQVHRDAAAWPSLLRDQLVSPVRWRETVVTFGRLGVDRVVELGASPVLTGLVKRTDRSMARATVAEPADLEDLS